MVKQIKNRLEKILDELSKIGKLYDMRINEKKTKGWESLGNWEGDNSSIRTIEGQGIEQVN